MKAAVIFFMLYAFAYGGEYDEHFDNKGPDQNYNDYFDEGGESLSIPEILDKYYDASTPDNSIPSGAVDAPSGSENGYDLGSSLSGGVSSEGGLKGLMNNMQTGTGIETLGDTYVCLSDNITYADKDECRSNCSGGCEIYKFSVELSCQKSEEILKVTPVNMLAANTPLNIIYDGAVYTTPPVTAVCGNGYMSGDTGYIWDISNSKISFTAVPPNAPADAKYKLGQCRDFRGKTFMAYFQDYYRDIGYALEANVGKLGYIVSHTVNSDMSLTVNVITSGSCDGNTLNSAIPNREAIEKMRGGGFNSSEAMAVAQSDEHFKTITEGQDYRERSCTVSNIVRFVSDTETASGSRKGLLCSEDNIDARLVRLSGGSYAVDIIDYFDYPHQQCGWAVDIDPPLTDDGWHRLDIFESPYQIKNMNVEINGYLPKCSGSYTFKLNDGATRGGSLIDCPGYWPASEKTPVEIRYSYTYEYLKEELSVSEIDGCSSMPEDCKLVSESICGTDGADCVETVKNGTHTGFKPKKICQEISTSLDRYMVCSDGGVITASGVNSTFSVPGGFFTVKRTYSCFSGKDGYDYSLFIKQDNTVSDTINVAPDGDVTFSGIGMDGNVASYKTNISLKDPECMQTCKVTAPVSVEEDEVVVKDGESVRRPATVTVNGVTKPMETSYYKSCTQKDDKWSCPVSDGERITQKCGCPDDFMDTIIQLKIISESASNMKCSSK